MNDQHQIRVLSVQLSYIRREGDMQTVQPSVVGLEIVDFGHGLVKVRASFVIQEARHADCVNALVAQAN